ncbi:hypothetical protein [Pedobacter agri]|uniref:DUF1351 domain-containing protein n=1 Tax=Pedobacter agri TaxID=454586 RepID=A0A9X3DCT1_9SPHI|nr:hypothetical protein [Pedobacter agri]MCX3264785.1 hypothetical protein [Pedobacter agri]
MSTTVENQTQELIKVEEITSTMAGAGEVLAKNQNLLANAVAKAKLLIDTAASGMSDELDAEINTWQLNAKKALTIMNDRRSPITQLMTKMAKVFTNMEADLDPTKPASYYTQAQNLRNQWAKEKAELKRIEEAKIKAKQDKDNEAINLKAEIAKQVRDLYNQKLFAFKGYMSKLFNGLDLTNATETSAKIKAVAQVYPVDKFNELVPTLFASHHNNEELTALITEIRDGLYQELSVNYTKNIEAEKNRLTDLIPSRINELNAIAKSSKAEKERLEKEAKERQEREAAQLLKDQEAQKLADQKRIDDEKKMNEAAAAFDAQASIAQLTSEQAKTKESYVIEVSDAQGWGAIFLFWFEHEGKGLTPADIEKKTMKQMKAFAEKKAGIKGGGVFIDNPYVAYIDEVKAVVTK